MIGKGVVGLTRRTPRKSRGATGGERSEAQGASGTDRGSSLTRQRPINRREADRGNRGPRCRDRSRPRRSEPPKASATPGQQTYRPARSPGRSGVADRRRHNDGGRTNRLWAPGPSLRRQPVRHRSWSRHVRANTRRHERVRAPPSRRLHNQTNSRLLRADARERRGAPARRMRAGRSRRVSGIGGTGSLDRTPHATGDDDYPLMLRMTSIDAKT